MASCPEGKKIGVRVGAIFQAANIFPVIYMFIQLYWKWRDTATLYALGSLGLADCVLFATLWDRTVPFGGDEISLWIYLGLLLSGLVGTTGLVVIFGYAAKFRPQHMSALSTGLGATGLVTAGFALIQGGGANTAEARFSFSAFFVIIAVFQGLPIVCLYLLERPSLQRHLLRSPEDEAASAHRAPDDGTAGSGSSQAKPASEDQALLPGQKRAARPSVWEVFRHAKNPLINQYVTATCTYLVIPALWPYLAHDDDDPILLWLPNVYLICNVVGRYLTSFVQPMRLELPNAVQVTLTLVFCAGAFRLLGTTVTVRASYVIMMVFFSAMNGITNTWVYVHIGKRLSHRLGDAAARWAGIVNQAGAISGTLLSLLLIESKALR